MNKRIVNLLMKGATTAELRNKLNLNSKELALKLTELKNSGYLLDNYFHADKGKSVVIRRNFNYTKSKDTRINFTNNTFRFICISDTHFGNKKDNFDYIKRIYDYACKEGIKNIIHLGDLIEGYSVHIKNENNLKHTDPLEIAHYVSTNYPQDGNIMNYILMGNHDYRTVNYNGIDLSTILPNTRLDMEFLGYFHSTINILNDRISLHHPSISGQDISYNQELETYYKNDKKKPSMYLRGHCHFGKVDTYNNYPLIQLPSLFDDNNTPGAMDITLQFKDKLIDTIYINTLAVEPKVAKTLELTHKINR